MDRRTSAVLRSEAGMFGLIGELLEAAETGDRQRFDEVYEHCLTRVYSIAWRVVRDRERAEELTARVLLDAVGYKE